MNEVFLLSLFSFLFSFLFFSFFFSRHSLCPRENEKQKPGWKEGEEEVDGGDLGTCLDLYICLLVLEEGTWLDECQVNTYFIKW